MPLWAALDPEKTVESQKARFLELASVSWAAKLLAINSALAWVIVAYIPVRRCPHFATSFFSHRAIAKVALLSGTHHSAAVRRPYANMQSQASVRVVSNLGRRLAAADRVHDCHISTANQPRQGGPSLRSRLHI